MDGRAQRLGGGERLVGGVLQVSVVVLGNQQGGHGSSFSLEHAGFDFQLLDQFGHGTDLHAGLAAAGLGGLDDLQARADVDAERLGRGLVERLLLGLHDVGQATHSAAR